MPIYHFNVRDGTNLIDADGTDLPSIVLALLEAVRLAGTLLEEGAHHIQPGSHWQMEVTDHEGLTLFHLDFNVAASPAAEAAMGKPS